MASTIQIRKITLGSGRPKICIPFTDTKKEALLSSAKDVTRPDSHCDLVEWRADFFESLLTPENPVDSGSLQATLTAFRNTLGEIPLLFTIRTKAEGGEIAIDTDSYVQINRTAIESGCIDLVDVELSRGEDAVRAIAEAAHRAGTAVIGSCHDFSGTPAKEDIVATLCRTQDLGCDIAKYAVMPTSERDVLTLLDATLTMKEEHPKTPVITMSMGKLGAISRISGELFGSCLSFGTAGAASAPGQLPADMLSQFFNTLRPF